MYKDNIGLTQILCGLVIIYMKIISIYKKKNHKSEALCFLICKFKIDYHLVKWNICYKVHYDLK